MSGNTNKSEWGEKADAALRSYLAALSSGRGRQFEKMIEGGAEYYRVKRRALIAKMPEPFRVLSKTRQGIATIRFTARAQPDFIGCIEGGRALVFEAKHTDKERLYARALTPTQAAALDAYHKRGAIAAVCAGIKDDSFMIPWPVFAEMKKNFGRLYITAADVEAWRVKFNGVILFLDYADPHTRIIAE